MVSIESMLHLQGKAVLSSMIEYGLKLSFWVHNFGSMQVVTSDKVTELWLQIHSKGGQVLQKVSVPLDSLQSERERR